MKALILAAGRGRRVEPLTSSIPKPMIPIVHRPVMEILVDQLRRHGFDEIVVNTGHLAPEIEGYFRDGSRFGVQIGYAFEGYKSNGAVNSRPLGSAGVMRDIQAHSGFFDTTFAVVCANAVVDVDLSAMLTFHRARKAIATVALKSLPVERLAGKRIAVCNGENRVVAFADPAQAGGAQEQYATTGIHLFEPEILSRIAPRGTCRIGEDLLPRLAACGEGVYGFEPPFFQWFDIARPQDYHSTVMKAMVGYIRNFKLPGRQVREGVWAGTNVRADFDTLKCSGPVYIGGSAAIGADCTLVGPAVIGAGAQIGEGTHLERSIVLDQTRVSPLSYLRNKVVGGSFCIDADGTVLDERHTDTSWLFADARSLNPSLTDDQRWVVANAMETIKAA